MSSEQAHGPSTARDGERPRVAADPGREAATAPQEPTHEREDADVVVDVPQLTLEELAFELRGTGALEHVSLEVKGLQAGVFVTADLEHLALLARGQVRARSSDVSGTAREGERPFRRRVLGRGRPEPGGEGQQERGEDQRDAGGHERSEEGERDGEEGRGEHVRRRVVEVARHGSKAATLAAVGAAGGALAESRMGGRGRRSPHVRLPRPKAALPDGGDVVRRVRRRLPG